MQRNIYRYAPNYGQPWTPEEDAAIRQPISYREAATRLGRTTVAVIDRRRVLGVAVLGPRGRPLPADKENTK